MKDTDVTEGLEGCAQIGPSDEFIVCPVALGRVAVLPDKNDKLVVQPDNHVDQVRLCCTP